VAVRFGTDGIRGIANAELTPELVLALGRAAARVLPAERFVVGRDTRRSGTMLQAALSAGLAAEGADVVDLGVLPTPAIAWRCAQWGVPGAIVSASHNPFADNGVKLLAAGGLKLPVATELAIEAELDAICSASERPVRSPVGHGVGRLVAEDSRDAYVEHLVGLLDGRRLDGLTVVLDAANGAAFLVGPDAFGRVGATVHVLSCDPDGTNINESCGSTHPEALAEEVRRIGADLGVAFDGDADRVVAVDAEGGIVTGDELLVLFARDLAHRGRLAGRTLVVTVMSNLGLHRAMAEDSIAVRETSVGDRNVLEALDADGLALGGEQSGHIIFREMATTGDGILTGLLLADLVLRAQQPLADLVAGAMTRFPQRLVNVSVPDPTSVVEDPVVLDEVARVAEELGDAGRVLLRASGTEPLIRVMVEAADLAVAEAAVERLRNAVLTSGTPLVAGRDEETDNTPG
jgi:phosphoglucosamine mutase